MGGLLAGDGDDHRRLVRRPGLRVGEQLARYLHGASAVVVKGDGGGGLEVAEFAGQLLRLQGRFALAFARFALEPQLFGVVIARGEDDANTHTLVLETLGGAVDVEGELGGHPLAGGQ